MRPERPGDPHFKRQRTTDQQPEEPDFRHWQDRVVGAASAHLMPSRLYFIRHGETAWSATGQHTGHTDLPLTAQGEREAGELAERLRAVPFSRVFTSPRRRARQTCELAGLAAAGEIDPDLAEWDYGDYEGRRSVEILQERPDWNIYRDGCPRGEFPGQILARADRCIARFQVLEGTVAVFSHGQFGRVLLTRWLGLPIDSVPRFQLLTASISILSFERPAPAPPAIALWNFTGRNLA